MLVTLIYLAAKNGAVSCCSLITSAIIMAHKESCLIKFVDTLIKLCKKYIMHKKVTLACLYEIYLFMYILAVKLVT